MPTPVVATKPGEYTRVGLETEVKIPWLTFLFTCLILAILDSCAWGAIWLIVDRFSTRPGAFWRWFSDNGWRWYVITLIACVVVAALVYLYRLVIEQLAKSTPTYDTLDPRLGVWNPFGHPWYDEDEDEPEMEQDVIDVNVNAESSGGRRRQRTLIDFPVDRKARTFYRAVANETASFSQREAARFWIGRGKFNQMRDALLERGLADWKDGDHENLGVNLSHAAMRTFEVLGRGR